MGPGVRLLPGANLPGHGQMKPEQLEIARLKRDVAKLEAVAARVSLAIWPIASLSL